MARPTPELVLALRQTAARLADGAPFRWAHQGACICGNLAQVVTSHERAEIHRLALQRAGDWGQHAIDFCSTSGFPIDHILSQLFELGLEREDIGHLERLDDNRVLRRLPPKMRHLDKRKREDAVLYIRLMADMIQDELFATKGLTLDGSGQDSGEHAALAVHDELAPAE